MVYMTNGCGATADQMRAEDELDQAITDSQIFDEKMPGLQAENIRSAKAKILQSISEDLDFWIERAQEGSLLAQDAWENVFRTEMAQDLKDTLSDELRSFDALSEDASK